MATLTEQMQTLVEQTQAAAIQEQAKARVKYRELLSRNASPKAGDAAKMREVIAVLGKTPTNLAVDLAAMEEAAARQPLADRLPAAEAARQKAWEAVAESAAETERVIRARREVDNRLYGEASGLVLECQRFDRAAQQLRQLRMNRPDLFGDTPSASASAVQ